MCPGSLQVAIEEIHLAPAFDEPALAGGEVGDRVIVGQRRRRHDRRVDRSRPGDAPDDGGQERFAEQREENFAGEPGAAGSCLDDRDRAGHASPPTCEVIAATAGDPIAVGSICAVIAAAIALVGSPRR